jgi:SAM-dependent methyltransferase
VAAAAWDNKYEHDRRSRADLDRAAKVATYRVTRDLVRPGQRVLEAGSGTGRLIVRLAMDEDVDAVGVDNAPQSIEMGVALVADAGSLRGRATFVEGDLYALPFPDQHFDVVFSDSVFEHLERPGDALAEARRVVRPGGAVVISVPNRWRPDGWDLYRRLAHPPYRQDSFSPPELRRLFREHGLEPGGVFGDELWLPRNLGLLRARLRRGGAAPGAGAGAGPGRRGGAPPRTAPPAAKRVAAALLPQALHVNIGIVGRRVDR